MFRYISAERRVPQDHPLRAIRTMADRALKKLDQRFAGQYAPEERPSIAPERLLRALLLQALYTVRSERLLMEQLDYNFLFREFVGLSIDHPVWEVTVFTKNRDRLLKGEVAEAFFAAVLRKPASAVCSRTIARRACSIPALRSPKSTGFSKLKALNVTGASPSWCAKSVLNFGGSAQLSTSRSAIPNSDAHRHRNCRDHLSHRNHGTP
jgi:transposase